ncbi:MAG: GntR family transcriptional regulator [Hyphomicrobiales bacterium]|nr:MAG: GntR family transcriptional regulator [Hyphomicrobiales bacterium]
MIFSKNKSEDLTVVAMLASVLRRDISFGVLRPDEKLKIEALRQRYGGSNHSMRETLRILGAEGLVEATAQRGFRVTSATEDDLRDVMRVRIEIETTGLSWALERGDVHWEGQVMAAHHALRKTENAVRDNPDDLTALEWDEASRAFYAMLIEASGSSRLIDLQKNLFDQSRRYRLALLREGRLDFDARGKRQDQLIKALLARDEAMALMALKQEISAEIQGET